MLCLDRQMHTPGASTYLEDEFQNAIDGKNLSVAPLAVLLVTDLEHAEELLRVRASDFKGTPRGFVKLLRRWDTNRRGWPTW